MISLLLKCAGVVFWIAVLGGIGFLLVNKNIYRKTVAEAGKITWILCAVSILLLGALSLKVMSISPLYNGEIPQHRSQYEDLTESFFNGHLYLDYEVDEKLLAMENPYDPQARIDNEVPFRWDSAFYQGKYYMYFGVVPVLLLFLPYRLITGTALAGYAATWVFLMIAIAGIYQLFYRFTLRFHKNLPLLLYLLGSFTFSLMSIWYCIDCPQLYCTAISSAIAMEVWSLCFFFESVYMATKENKQILLAFFGALFGALAFGCRPTIALGNLLVIPMMITYFKEKKITGKLVGKLALAASPYLAVAVGLMIYNFLRFDSPLEFGQAHQLTVADQHAYSNMFVTLANLGLGNLLSGLQFCFFNPLHTYVFFPFIDAGGLFFNHPILLANVLMVLPRPLKEMRKDHTAGLLWMIPVTVLLIAVLDILWTPFLLVRYHMDLNYLLAIGAYASLMYLHKAYMKEEGMGSRVLAVLLVLAALQNAWLIILPQDSNFTAYYPEMLSLLSRVFLFWQS